MFDITAMLAKGAESLVTDLTKAALEKAGATFRDKHPYKKMNLKPYLEHTLEKCRRLKTIINADYPIDMLDFYVHLEFKVGEAKKNLDDYTVIDAIPDKKRAFIFGAAGSGKSMFMRYLWICYFVRPHGKIPLFIELRDLNTFDGDDLLAFIYSTIANIDVRRQKNAIDEDSFFAAIDEGQFTFLFDGFDELDEARRRIYGPQLIRLAGIESNIVVVSSRPDPRLAAWPSFWNYNVSPLDKKRSLSLVRNVEFNAVVKKKFLQKLNSDLYDSHKDFASRPLLLLIMLLTFDTFADIPEKIHVFYDLAFDALFSRHDATKEAYHRKHYTTLSIDDFKRLLSYYCILTYKDQKWLFSEAEALEYIKHAAGIDQSQRELSSDAFLKDLLETVCVLQWDGLYITFSHRSFQEYFCAYGLLRLPQQFSRQLMVEYSRREQDSVLNMAFDMNKSYIGDNYFYPLCEEFTSIVCSHINLAYYLYRFCGTITIRYCPKRTYWPRRGLGWPGHSGFGFGLHHRPFDEFFDYNPGEFTPASREEELLLAIDIGRKFYNVFRLMDQLYSKKCSAYAEFKGTRYLTDADLSAYRETHVGKNAVKEEKSWVIRCLNGVEIELVVGDRQYGTLREQDANRDHMDEKSDHLKELLCWLETTEWFADTKANLNRMLGFIKEFSEGNRSWESEISHILDLK